jgi:hypothetical protein
MKTYILQYWQGAQSVVDQFNSIDLARKARQACGGVLYHKRQVSEIRNGYVYLHADDTQPID